MFFKKGTPVAYIGPALDPPLDGSGHNALKNVGDPEYFIHTKFHQNPSSSSVAKANYVFLYIYMH